LAAQESRARDFNELITEAQGKAAGAYLQSERMANSELQMLAEKQVEAEGIVNLISELGITSGYQKTADEARLAVVIWNSLAVGSMLGLIIVAFVVFLPEVASNQFNWPGFAGRVAVTVTIGILAAYSGSQAAKYLAVERHNRRRALEFAALEPFLRPLPEAEQQALRTKVGTLAFAQEERTESETRSPATALDLLKAADLKEATKLVTALSKLFRGGAAEDK
jgi:hypothetical protein